MGPIWGRQDPGGPHVGLMNFAIWVRKTCVLVSNPRSNKQHFHLVKLNILDMDMSLHKKAWDDEIFYKTQTNNKLWDLISLPTDRGHNWKEIIKAA